MVFPLTQNAVGKQRFSGVGVPASCSSVLFLIHLFSLWANALGKTSKF